MPVKSLHRSMRVFQRYKHRVFDAWLSMSSTVHGSQTVLGCCPITSHLPSDADIGFSISDLNIYAGFFKSIKGWHHE